MERVDVVVVGAGPSGSTAAYFLAGNGVNVALLDKSKFPREKTCGDGLGPRSLQMLDKMGLSGWLDKGGYYRCNRVRIFSNNGAYFEAGILDEDTAYPHFVITPRIDLDQKLNTGRRHRVPALRNNTKDRSRPKAYRNSGTCRG